MFYNILVKCRAFSFILSTADKMCTSTNLFSSLRTEFLQRWREKDQTRCNFHADDQLFHFQQVWDEFEHFLTCSTKSIHFVVNVTFFIFRGNQAGSKFKYGRDDVCWLIHSFVHDLHGVWADLTEASWRSMNVNNNNKTKKKLVWWKMSAGICFTRKNKSCFFW